MAAVTHPFLYAGFNFDDINGDEADGAGTNWPIWPVYFDTFEGLVPLIVTDEMLEVFNTECADIVFPHEDNSIELPFEQLATTIPLEVATVMIDGEGNTIAFPWAPRTQVVRTDRKGVRVSGKSDTLAMPGGADTAAIRKAG